MKILKLRSTIDIQKLIEVLNCRFELAEKRISKLEDAYLESKQPEKQRETSSFYEASIMLIQKLDKES